MKPYRFLLSCLVLTLITLVLHADRVHAKAKAADRQVIVLFIEGLSFADLAQLQNYPHVDKWIAQGELGAMTIRAAGARNQPNAYLLLGSGGQAIYPEASGTIYQADEQTESGEAAIDRMRRFAGQLPVSPEQNSILFPGIFRLHAENQEKPFTPRVGLLGGILSQYGMTVGLYGNGDDQSQRHRDAALFAMDEKGMIPTGDISSRTYVHTLDYPDGRRTNYPYLLDRVTGEHRSGVIVVQLSDLARLYRAQNLMEPTHFQKQYKQILADLDSFVGQLLQKRSENQMIVVASALVNEAAIKEKSLLSPILLWKEGGAGNWLHSATTRQAGVVSGLDLLPTILDWLSLPIPRGLLGHPLGSDSMYVGTDLLQTRISEIDRIYKNRSPIMYTYVMLQIIILIASALFWLWQKGEEKKEAEKLKRGIRLSLLSMLFFPVLFLIEPLLSWSVAPPVVLGFIIMFALGGALVVETWRLPGMLMLIAGLTMGALLLDGFTGAQLMQRSYLGYDPVIGARFYGLGNEYEGVVLGATILLVSSLYERRKAQASLFCKAAAVLLFTIVLLYMGAPSLGANAGGFLAATVGFGVAWFRLQAWRVGKKGLLLVTGGLVAGIGALIIINLSSAQPLTHVGRVANDIVQGNWEEVMKIVERKLEMNWRLVRVSGWSKVFAVSLIVITLLSLRADRYLRNLSEQYPYLVKGFHGLIAGSLAGLLLNDSGIVTAATSIIFFVVPALYAAIGDPLDREYST